MSAHVGRMVAERNGLAVINCSECGFPHLRDILTAEQLEAYYRTTFWPDTKADGFARMMRQRKWLEATYGDWLEVLESHRVGGGRQDLLDVGSGFGLFVKCAHNAGWTAEGIEPSTFARERMVEIGLGDGWVHGTTWTPSFGSGRKFTAIVAMWFLEHIPNPSEFIRWCHEHLFGNGLLMIVVPNEWTVAQEAANARVERKFWWIDETHINYFSAGSLANLLGRCGFVVVDWLGTYQIEELIVDDRTNYVDHPEIGEDMHKNWVQGPDCCVSREERLGLSRSRGFLGAGRDIVMICRKDDKSTTWSQL